MANEKKIKIVVDKTGAQRALSAIEKQLGSVGLRADGLDETFTGLGSKGVIAAAGVAAVGSAAIVTASKLYSFAQSQTAVMVNMAILAERSNMNVESFQALAYAGASVNKSQEDMQGIIQDTNDRIGELTGEGVGELTYAFEKFLKPAGLTIEKLKEMGGQDVLIAVTKAMEDGGASGNELTTVLEMIASNASHLKPLLIDNGKAMKSLSREADSMGLIISKEQIDQAREFNVESRKITSQIDVMKNLFAIGLTPTMSAFNRVIQQTNKDLDYMFNITDESKAASLQKELYEISEAIGKQFNSSKKYGGGSLLDALNPFAKKGDLEFLKKQSAEVFAELQLVQDRINERRKRISDTGSGSGTDGASGGGSGYDGSNDDKKKETLKKQADSYIGVINQRNMDEFDLLDAKQATETEKLNEYRESGALSAAEHKAAMIALEQGYADALYEIMLNESNREAELQAKDADRELKAADKKRKVEEKKKKDEQKEVVNMAYQTNAMLDNVADLAQGRSDKLNAIAQGAATFQATIAMYSAAVKAMDSWGADSAVQRIANASMILGMGASLISGIQGASSRQGGGDMSGTYQTGGGAHTSNPEMFTDRITGKSYMTGNGNMTPAHQLKQGGSGGGFNLTVNNMGQPMNAEVTDNGIDESGVRQLIMSMTPDIMAKEGGNPSSMFNQSRGTIEKIQPEFN